MKSIVACQSSELPERLFSDNLSTMSYNPLFLRMSMASWSLINSLRLLVNSAFFPDPSEKFVTDFFMPDCQDNDLPFFDPIINAKIPAS
jgi:hypothetical protein